jgi:hypothetical protein
LFSGSLGAVTTYGPPANYTVGLDGIFSGIGQVSGSDGTSCSGSLIAPNIVLTAYHCLEPNMTVTFADATGSPVYTVTQQIAYPGASAGYDDVALLVLSTNAAAGIEIYSLSTDTNEADLLGDTITVAGYGYGGQGTEMTGYGTLRAGLNTIDGFWTSSNSNALAFTFTDGSAQQDGQEGFTCFGDSGGPSFLGNTLGNSITPTIVGIHDFIYSSTSPTPTCSFGEIAGDQPVAAFITFIDSEEAIIDSPAPEPGTWATLATGLGVIILGRRRLHDAMLGIARMTERRRDS